jgi:hypothetical protein
MYHKKPLEITVPLKKIYHRFPYIGDASTKLEFDLKSLIESFYPQIDLNMAFYNDFKISTFFKTKDVVPVELRSNIIYKYQCGICQDSYIGLSTKTARFRWCQHLGISFRTLRPLGKVDFSPARQHSEDKNHPISFSNFSILNQTNDRSDIKLLESLYIYTHKPELNIASASTPLHIVN